MRCHTKLDFAETYHFGHNLCNSGPFLLKMGLKCAHVFKGYYMHNWLPLKPVVLFEKHATATASTVLISLVQFGFQSFSGWMEGFERVS